MIGVGSCRRPPSSLTQTTCLPYVELAAPDDINRERDNDSKNFKTSWKLNYPTPIVYFINPFANLFL